MKHKYKSKKGISFLLVFGSYGGFHITLSKSSLHICIAFLAFTIFFYDVENALAMMLNEKDQETSKENLNISDVMHRFPNNREIWEWWKKQRFQKEQGEQEYTMIFEIDLPEILKAFTEHFINGV